jgi:hypothetical protein
MATQMDRARKALSRNQRSVFKMAQARDLSNTAVHDMLAQPHSQKILEVLELAKLALSGEDISTYVRAQPQNSKRGLQQLVSARPTLPITESERDELSKIPMNHLSFGQRQELVMCMF